MRATAGLMRVQESGGTVRAPSLLRWPGVIKTLIEIIEEPLKTLKDYPPVQGGSSPNLSPMVPDYLKQLKASMSPT